MSAYSERPFSGRFFNSQIDLLDESLIIGKDRFVLSDFLDRPVQTLDGIRRIRQGPDFRRIFEYESSFHSSGITTSLGRLGSKRPAVSLRACLALILMNIYSFV